MTLSQAWMCQAESDLRAARRLDNLHDSQTRCQAISKYQQAIEKAIKGVLDRLHSINLVRSGPDRKHSVARYASVLSGFPPTKHNRHLLDQLRRLFTKSVIDQINLLDSLVPEYPASGSLAKRNHEYPFQDDTGNWHAPAEEGAFTSGEIKRIRGCAWKLVRQLSKIQKALDLLYP